MDKVQIVALMAATIHAARTAGPTDQAGYSQIAEEAWALYDSVEAEAVKRYSRR